MSNFLFDMTTGEWEEAMSYAMEHIIPCSKCGADMILDHESHLSMGYSFCSENCMIEAEQAMFARLKDLELAQIEDEEQWRYHNEA